LVFASACFIYSSITNFDDYLQGETGANVLVGIQIPLSEMDEFQEQADNLGYLYALENINQVYDLLMH